MTDQTEGAEVGWMLDRLVDHGYGGGLHGTCYGCPFASEPLDRYGDPDPDVWNDPTEAYFRCSLPTRSEAERLAWGEDAPCTDKEWIAAIKVKVAAAEARGAQAVLADLHDRMVAAADSLYFLAQDADEDRRMAKRQGVLLAKGYVYEAIAAARAAAAAAGGGA